MTSLLINANALHIPYCAGNSVIRSIMGELSQNWRSMSSDICHILFVTIVTCNGPRICYAVTINSIPKKRRVIGG